jgi:hypothetical protein
MGRSDGWHAQIAVRAPWGCNNYTFRYLAPGHLKMNDLGHRATCVLPLWIAGPLTSRCRWLELWLFVMYRFATTLHLSDLYPIYLHYDGMGLEDCSLLAHNCLWIIRAIAGPALKYKAVLWQFGVYIGPHSCRFMSCCVSIPGNPCPLMQVVVCPGGWMIVL